MKLETVFSCLNCENLLRNFICQKHNQSVSVDTFCASHTYQGSITKNSSCANCLHFGQVSCSKPEESSDSMLCFDWQGSSNS
tara:strand:- start:486 stop:731 length:246 start_codon:yes stop_codon:yes gene_type:complete